MIKTVITIPFSSDPTTGSIVNSTGDEFRVLKDTPVIIPNDAVNVQFRVLQSSIWNTVANISSANLNNTVDFTVAATPYSFVLPDGLYTIEGLNSAFQFGLLSLGLDTNLIVLYGDESTQKIIFEFNAVDVQMDFTTANNLGDILGVDSRLLPLVASTDGQQEFADNVAAFNTIEYFTITTPNLVVGGLPINNRTFGILHKHIISAPVGSQSNYSPRHPSVVDASNLKGRSIQNWQFALRDQQNRSLLVNEIWSFDLELSYERYR